MNSKNQIRVGVSSSLIDLKAELIKKQRELQQSKSQQKGVTKSVAKSQLRASKLVHKKNSGVDRRNAADLEEHARSERTYEHAKQVLELKAKLYEKMTAEALDHEVNEHPVLANALVNFQQKAIDNYQESKKIQIKADQEEDDDEMVEFIDTLGRTRRVPKSQLAKTMAEEEQLAREENPTLNNNEDVEKDAKEGNYSAVPPPTVLNLSNLMSEEQVTDQKHRKWDEETTAATHKDNIHYQDVLFDEVRTHGVAYFGFSKDEEKRAEEIQNLKKLSEATRNTREKVLKEREHKSTQLKARLRKIRNKKRAKLGLPPIEDSLDDDEKKKEVDRKEEGESSAKTTKFGSDSEKEDGDNAEDTNEAETKKEMRPWDFGKPGVYGPKPINFDELDEKYLKERRTERVSDFAPPTTYFTKNKNYGQPPPSTSSTGSKYGNFVQSMENAVKNANMKIPPPPPQHQQQQKLYDPSPNISHRQQAKQVQMPIVDELPAPIPDSVDYLKRGRGAEVAPPQTFDFIHGEVKPQTSVNKSINKCDSSSISSSIAEGVRALREQVEVKKMKQQQQKMEKQSFFSKVGPEAEEGDEDNE